jgi:predicted Zn-ribbon and HTH transcriptional regulator
MRIANCNQCGVEFEMKPTERKTMVLYCPECKAEREESIQDAVWLWVNDEAREIAKKNTLTNKK